MRPLLGLVLRFDLHGRRRRVTASASGDHGVASAVATDHAPAGADGGMDLGHRVPPPIGNLRS